MMILTRPYPRLRSFSLRFLFGLLTTFAILLGVLAYRKNQVTRHENAIARIVESGGRPTLTEWVGNSGAIVANPEDAESTFLSSIWVMPSISAPLIDLSAPELTAESLQSLVPYLGNIICREGENELGKSYTVVMLTGNPNVNPHLLSELTEALPNCRIMYRPKTNENPLVGQYGK